MYIFSDRNGSRRGSQTRQKDVCLGKLAIGKKLLQKPFLVEFTLYLLYRQECAWREGERALQVFGFI